MWWPILLINFSQKIIALWSYEFSLCWECGILLFLNPAVVKSNQLGILQMSDEHHAWRPSSALTKTGIVNDKPASYFQQKFGGGFLVTGNFLHLLNLLAWPRKCVTHKTFRSNAKFHAQTPTTRTCTITVETFAQKLVFFFLMDSLGIALMWKWSVLFDVHKHSLQLYIFGFGCRRVQI